jgi:FlaA1/EpsC-like NDP-sugar epimerase
VLGVRVRGGREHIGETAEQFHADSLLIAIPSADRELIGKLTMSGQEAGLDVKVLPSLTDFVGPNVDITDIRDVREEDLLGRRGIDTDVESIAGYITGKRVLVTGAGGSIGSELCRQLVLYGPSELLKLDRDESGLHAVELSITGRALLDSGDLVVRDIRDREGLFEVFAAHRPQVVFHAAALKHLPLLQQFPGEAVRTNVIGTRNVLDAAASVGVEAFVNISTDKAADPISVLGYSKRIAERMTSYLALDHPGRWVSVRFGNVLGSRGSVLTTFRTQVEAGGPITVTDAGATRFFMTIKEAVELVIQAGGIGRSGEVLVLDMGDPVRIGEVAARLAAAASRPIDITYTGLREGEKLEESLFGSDEADDRPFHRLISHVAVPPLDPATTDDLPERGGAEVISIGLARASSYTSAALER